MDSSIWMDAWRKSWAMLCGVWSKYPPESIGTGLAPGAGFSFSRKNSISGWV
jgi:hypothetical protein